MSNTEEQIDIVVNVTEALREVANVHKVLNMLQAAEEQEKLVSGRVNALNAEKESLTKDVEAMQSRFNKLEADITAARKKNKADAEASAKASKEAFLKQENEQTEALLAIEAAIAEAREQYEEEIAALIERKKEATADLNEVQNQLAEIRRKVG